MPKFISSCQTHTTHAILSFTSAHLLVILHINDRLLPLACWNSALEHDVNLTV